MGFASWNFVNFVNLFYFIYIYIYIANLCVSVFRSEEKQKNKPTTIVVVMIVYYNGYIILLC